MDKPKYHLLTKSREDTGRKIKNDPRVFKEYSNTIDDVYKNIYDYNPKRIRKILVVLDNMIADISTNKKFHFIVKELFIGFRKLNVSLVFITQSYFFIPKDVRLNSAHYQIIKIHSKKELQSISSNHPANIDYKGFINVY